MKNLLIITVLLLLITSCAKNTATSTNPAANQISSSVQSTGLTPNELWHRNHKIMISTNEKACSVSNSLRKAVTLCSPLIYIRGELPDMTEDNIKEIVDTVHNDMYATNSYFETFVKVDPTCPMITKINYNLPTANESSKLLVDKFYSESDADRYINLCNRVKKYGFMDSFNGICNETNPNMYPIP